MTFLHPAFLWGLLGLAIPLIVHFFYLRRSRKYPFSHTRIVERLLQANRPYIRLSHLILLLIRLALVAVIVLIFARPVLSRVQWSSEKVSAILIVDVSPSIHENFSQALALAEELLKKDAEISEVKIISTDQLYSDRRFISRQEALAVLKEIRPADMGYPLSQILRQLDLHFRGSQFSRRRVYVVSDFQASAVGNISEIPKSDSVEYVLASIPLDLTGNAYIDSVAITGTDRNRLLRWHVVGPDQKTVSVRVGDRTVLAAAGWHETPWPDGAAYLTLSLSGDTKEFDNTYYAGLIRYLPRSRRVIWKGLPAARPSFERLSRLLGFSLHQEEGAMALWVDYLPSESSWLAKLQQGATLIVFPPDGLIPKQWADHFLSRRVAMEAQEEVAGLSLDLQPRSHYLWEEVFVTRTSTGVLPDVFRTERLYRFSPQGGYPVLSTSQGQTLLWEIPWDKGRVFLFTFPISRSNFGETSLFVPLFARMYDIEARKDQLPPAIQLGKETVLSFSQWRAGQPLRLRLQEDGSEVVFTVMAAGEGAQVVLGMYPMKAGLYRAYMGESELGYLGVNISSGESSSAVLPFEAWERAGLRVRSAQVGLATSERQSFWRAWSLWVMLSILLIGLETYWARRLLFP